MTFSPEQEVTLAILRSANCPDPETVVRTLPLEAALVGAEMGPVILSLAESYLGALRILGELSPEIRERVVRLALDLAEP